MQTSRKSSEVKTKSKEKSKEETPRKQDEKPKKSFNNSTPRNFVQKSTTADIYAQKKTGQVSKAPKKVPGTSQITNASPMKDLLKASSSVSVRRDDKKPKITRKKEAKPILNSARTPRTAKSLPFVNVTVNSPISKRKLNLNNDVLTKNTGSGDRINKNVDSPIAKRKITEKSNDAKVLPKNGGKDGAERMRSKTRTLEEDEVKVLTPEIVDNNAGMLNLSKKLTAKPKAFFIDLDESQSKTQKEKSSDEEAEVSYEDDFESYESDFDSYHETSSDHKTSDDDQKSSDEDHEEGDGEENNEEEAVESNLKEVKDEEKMLDSGSFDLRDQRSANRKAAVMDFILEDEDGEKKTSFTDEGFQEMSSSSAVSSMKTVHVDVLDRPMFIDFSKSKENKRKRKINEQLKQRAKDILSMVTLHEMSYSLFEMQPIPYDLYMATFGRSNYTQIAVQTYDDGIHEEVQTEEILCEEKWTQNPVEFSKNDICIKKGLKTKKYSKSHEDYLSKFSFLINNNRNDEISNAINLDRNYMENPLRVYLEQKDGVGSCSMLPYEKYKEKLKDNDYNTQRLNKFLKKTVSRISHVLSINKGSQDISALVKNSKIPFSKGYMPVSLQNITDNNIMFVKYSKITQIIFSMTKSNLIMTVHKNSLIGVEKKSIICLWDLSVAITIPQKILIVIDNVSIGRLKGNSDGIFIAALEDGSIHLWDLSEKPTWRCDVAKEENPATIVEIHSEKLTQTEIDREWNLKNRNVSYDQPLLRCTLQSCAYTSSAANIQNKDAIDSIVGLEFVGESASVNQDGGRRIVGQICILQRIGVLKLYSIIQEKTKTIQDIGKAYWSKMKLEKNQTIILFDQFTNTINTKDNEFNLNAAKKRLSSRKQVRNVLKKQNSRPKSAADFDRPSSAASVRSRVLQVEKNVTNMWENGVICNDLKVIKLNNVDNYLVAKNNGEVVCCTRSLGATKINRFCVANDGSSVTCLEVSQHGLPYFLAATDSGTVNLFSMHDARVLLMLDCRNGPPSTEKYQSDSKGRYVGTVRSPTHTHVQKMKLPITSLLWSRSNPCCIYTLLQNTLQSWELTHSDIYAKTATENAAVMCVAGDDALALLTPEGEIQIHKLTSEQQNNAHVEIFKKYVALL